MHGKPPRIDSIAGQGHILVDVHVGRGIAQLSPTAPGAPHHHRRHRVRAAKRPGGLTDIPGRQCGTDECGADALRLTVRINIIKEGDDLHVHPIGAPVFLEHLRRPGGHVPEGEVLPHEDCPRPESPHENIGEILLGHDAREGPVEDENDNVINADLGSNRRPLLNRGQQWQHVLRPNHLNGVRIEGDHHRLHSQLPSPINSGLQQRLVAAVNPIEHADGDHTRAKTLGNGIESMPNPHSTRVAHMDMDRFGGLVLIDKPAGYTSHDVVARVRRILHTKHVGHAGTLDPMATGLLVLGVERGTRFLAHLSANTKAYDATIRLGVATLTDDAEGEITAVAAAPDLAALTAGSDTEVAARIESALNEFRGEIQQRPSAVSAIKVKGQRAYARVRAGEDVELPARPVTVFTLTATAVRRATNQPAPNTADVPVIDVDVHVECSSGTYIRAIARDLGELLHVGGHLTSLRRTSVGAYQVANAVSLEELERTPQVSLPLDQAILTSFPSLAVTADEAAALSHGKRLPGRIDTGVHAAVDPNGHVIALIAPVAEHNPQAGMKTVFVARPSTLT